MAKDLIEASRVSYSIRGINGTFEEIKTGCLQRIADATEQMCLDREKLERDYKNMLSSRDFYRAKAERLFRRLSATKGVVTRLKNAKSN